MVGLLVGSHCSDGNEVVAPDLVAAGIHAPGSSHPYRGCLISGPALIFVWTFMVGLLVGSHCSDGNEVVAPDLVAARIHVTTRVERFRVHLLTYLDDETYRRRILR